MDSVYVPRFQFQLGPIPRQQLRGHLQRPGPLMASRISIRTTKIGVFAFSFKPEEQGEGKYGSNLTEIVTMDMLLQQKQDGVLQRQKELVAKVTSIFSSCNDFYFGV